MGIKDNETIGLKSIIVKYLHHWKLFFGVGFISLIIAVLYLVLSPKTYEIISRAQIIDEEGTSGMSLSGDAAGMMKSFGLGGVTSGNIMIDDEVAVFESHDLIKNVVMKLGLNAQYSTSFFLPLSMYDETPLLMDADSMTLLTQDRTIEFSVKVGKDGTVTIKGDDGEEKKQFNYSSLPAVIQWNDYTFTLRSNPNYKTDGRIKLDITMTPPNWVAEDLSEEISVDTYSKNSNLIEFLYTDYERKRGRDILNTLIDEYNQRADKIKKKQANKELGFLKERINEMVTNLMETELNIEKYKTSHKITDIEFDMMFYSEQMKEIQKKMIELEMQSYAIKFMEDFISDPKNEYNLVPSLLGIEEGENGSTTIYNQLLVERERMLLNTNINNPTLYALEKQIKQLRKSVFLTIQNAQKSIRYAVGDMKEKEKMILARMDKVPLQEREYMDYVRQKEIYQGIYLILLQKQEEAIMKVGQDFDRALVVDKAYASSRPISPRKLFAALFMVVFTLVVSVGYLFCKEQFIELKKEFLKTKK
ncbi:GNVR domain-containing protein [Massilibacteroides sp.]|uniref:GumC family protein n=1 Tax=Massilibacteroides sp. TaxID=2034766 RepID=UPI002614D99F|nr:GNVR domain-containing protein [Massilibacteroides sp.]MDD4515323.1 tyrosine protein kinase [Massilibacteroides sp.]